MAKANKDGWIRHRGGKCPVEAGTLVDVKYRDGVIHYGTVALISTGCAAGNWVHERDKESAEAECDIMAWRPIKPAEQPEPVSEPEVAGRFDAIAMRDRIRQIDAEEANRNEEHLQAIEALEEERLSLVQRLADEGFQLIGKKADKVESLPREDWRVGDLVVRVVDGDDSDMPLNEPLPITFFDGSEYGQDVLVDDFFYPKVSSLKWHSRP